MRPDGASIRTGALWLAVVSAACASVAVAACRTVSDLSDVAAAPGKDADVAPPPSVPAPSLRVGVLVQGARAALTAPSGVHVWLRGEGDSAPRHVRLARATFEPASCGVRLAETGDGAVVAVVSPADPSALVAANGSRYRGLVEVRAAAGPSLTVVNVVDLENYVRGVVPNEVSPGASAPMEALKAQAVAARTYALSHLGEYSSRGFDLCATQACQVYRGADSEHPRSDRAVAETRGVIATWRGRPIHAYYTSACGGHTESGRDVFGDRAPYLRGVECVPEDHEGWVGRAGHGVAWQVRMTPAAVAETAARYGRVGSVQDLVARRTGVSGRVVELAVVGSDGEMLLRGVNVRWALGVPESLFVIGREKSGDGAVEQFVLTGLGRGHGVGLCQLGAAAMARSGAAFATILRHYYTGISLSSVAS